MRRTFIIVGGPLNGQTVGTQAVTREVHAIEHHWIDDTGKMNSTLLKIEDDKAIWPTP